MVGPVGFGNLNLISIQPGANLVTLTSSAAREVIVMNIRSLDMIYQFTKTLLIGENMVEHLYNVSARGDDCTIDTRMKSGQGWRGWILQAFVTQLKYSNQEFAPAVARAADALYEFIAFFQVASAKVAKAYMMYSWEVVFYYNPSTTIFLFFLVSCKTTHFQLLLCYLPLSELCCCMRVKDKHPDGGCKRGAHARSLVTTGRMGSSGALLKRHCNGRQEVSAITWRRERVHAKVLQVSRTVSNRALRHRTSHIVSCASRDCRNGGGYRQQRRR